MDLYTSLVRLKMALNNGELPPMTPVPESAHAIIDPAFTIGLGALTEDAERGLRCPVRGCGVYRHALSTHLTRMHADIGGTRAVRGLLEISQSVHLISSAYHAQKVAEAARRRGPLLAHLAHARSLRALRSPETREKANASIRTTYQNMGTRNLINRCEAQMKHAMIDLTHKLGRSPTLNEARTTLGDGFAGHVIAVYGTWNAAKARFGLEQYRRGHSKKVITRDAVLEALSAYYAAHGTLPNVNQAQRPNRAPLIPSRPVILKSMGTESWPEAMRRAAALLNIYGGRYGLPEKVEAAA